MTQISRTNVAADTYAALFASNPVLDMIAFDALPPFWRQWLRDKPHNYSAIQLWQQMSEQGITQMPTWLQEMIDG